MRIAQIAPLYESVPPKLYGGTERVVAYLTQEPRDLRGRFSSARMARDSAAVYVDVIDRQPRRVQRRAREAAA